MLLWDIALDDLGVDLGLRNVRVEAARDVLYDKRIFSLALKYEFELQAATVSILHGE